MRRKESQKTKGAGDHGAYGIGRAGHARKSTGQTEGQFGRDTKGRKGQFTGAGDSALTKK